MRFFSGLRGRRRRAVAALILAGAAMAAAAAAADPARREARRQANAALSLLAVSASPNQSASALFLDSSGGEPFQLIAAQIGDGISPRRWAPLYLEGFLAAAYYDPEIIAVGGGAADARWRNLSATGGLGWNFPVAPHLTFRPIVDVALGSITADADGLLPLPRDIPFARGGDFTAWGAGASAMLDYSRELGGIEVDSELRLTLMRLESFDQVFGASARADAASLGSWNRVRVPTGWQALGRPLRAVGELSASWLPGDQGEALRTRWLVQAGGGLELDFSATEAPLLKRARLMLRGVVGEQLTGVSVGIGLSF